MDIYDLIIVGGGPAAITAAIYAGRKKLKTFLIAKNWGGQMALTSSIENYPGIETISGMELTEKMKEQLERYQSVIPEKLVPDSRFLGDGSENDTITIKENTEAVEVEKGEIIKVKTDDGDYQSHALIIANGRIPKKLNIPGEDKFKGRGLSYCVHCDSPFFKGKDVAIIGGGNAGLEAALDLINYAKKIYILEFCSQLAADEVLRDKIKQFPQISVLTEAAAKEIKGDNFAQALVYEDKKLGKTKELAIEGVFSEIGWLANSNFIKDVVKLNQRGEIIIDKENRTSEPNIFAAGDITDVPEKQIIIAAGEGAKAALSAYKHLKSF